MNQLQRPIRTNPRYCAEYPFLSLIDDDAEGQFKTCLKVFPGLPACELQIMAQDCGLPEPWRRAARITLLNQESVCPLCGADRCEGQHNVVPYGANPADGFCVVVGQTEDIPY